MSDSESSSSSSSDSDSSSSSSSSKEEEVKKKRNKSSSSKEEAKKKRNKSSSSSSKKRKLKKKESSSSSSSSSSASSDEEEEEKKKKSTRKRNLSRDSKGGKEATSPKKKKEEGKERLASEEREGGEEREMEKTKDKDRLNDETAEEKANEGRKENVSINGSEKSRKKSIEQEKEQQQQHQPPAVEDDDDDWIGPLPSEAVTTKKRKALPFEKAYLNNLPSAQAYEKSFMHREIVTHLCVSKKSNFLLTASQDGHVKFWHKIEAEDAGRGATTSGGGAADMELLGSSSSSETSGKGQRGIEFVKHFRTHLAAVQDMQISPDGALAASVSPEKTCKVFDVVNFDMINMIKLDFTPACCGWIYHSGDAISALAVACKESHRISVFNGRGDALPIHVVEKLHSFEIAFIKYNPVEDLVISGDKNGMLEYWSGPRNDYAFPRAATWEFKTDTDLYELVKCKTWSPDLTFSPDGKSFATMSVDRRVRVFDSASGKLKKVVDETLKQYSELQQSKQQLPNMEFGRRMAVEKEIDRNQGLDRANVIFDESGHFLLYATMLGIKVVNLVTNRVAAMLGKMENARFLQLAMLQRSLTSSSKASLTMEMHSSENPGLKGDGFADPILFATGLKKNRFYLFTKFEPEWCKGENSSSTDRDVFNEKPSKEELVSATEDSSSARLAGNAVIHTTVGDIHIRLFYKECPKTIENFVVHAREGYYNGHLFHRVIKGFMVQTGDPTSTGCGGESIWGGEFEDEFHPSLRHDRPYTVSMANAGPNTNGSQFFITVVPTPWLDNKHTVFGRVDKGMEVVQKMSLARVNKKNDKPFDDINIISITVK